MYDGLFASDTLTLAHSAKYKAEKLALNSFQSLWTRLELPAKKLAIAGETTCY
ncbi:MAG: hypothetical protein KME08_08140 [Aphanothece sp. CMT-3BRIN-NPC111]|nr:hypothetical protein [Aphanothece sp. CMT-3BRIN-NPC111]